MSPRNGLGRQTGRSSKTQNKSGSRRRSRKSSAGWVRWWPVIAGVVIAPLAVRAMDYLTFVGPWYARALAPWTFLLQGRSLGFPAGWGDHISEGVLYAQFPVYGLLLMLLHRRLGWLTSFGLLLALHLMAYGALFLIVTS
jgi:hypothetical protein